MLGRQFYCVSGMNGPIHVDGMILHVNAANLMHRDRVDSVRKQPV
jgi:hypothetical protein